MQEDKQEDKLLEVRWLKSKPRAIKLSKVDRENGILSDVVMCQVGEAKGHEVNLEQQFIDDLVNYANENASTGLKARLGHPSMSNETMGSQLGAFKNFRVRGEQAIADLHLLDAAAKSPNGDLKEWVLSMAEEDPSFIMSSIVFKPGEQYRYDKDGKRFADDTDEFHSLTSDAFVSLGELYYCDLVEQGAATENLFSAQFNKDKFAVQVNEWLNDNAQIDSFIKENPDKIFSLLKSRGIELEEGSFFQKIKSLFNNSNEDIERLTIDNQKLSNDLAASIELLEKSEAATLGLQLTIDENTDALAVAESTIETLQTKIKELESQISEMDVTKFKKQAPEGFVKKSSWHKDNFKN